MRLVSVGTQKEILALAARIKWDIPYCNTMYNNLLQHGRGHSSHHSFLVLDHPRDSHAVLWRSNLAAGDGQHVGVHCREGDEGPFLEALSRECWVDWRGGLTFHHVPLHLAGPLQQLARSKGNTLSEVSYLTYMKQPPTLTEPIRVAAGFRVCRLGRAGVRHLLETNHYCKEISLDYACRLAQKLPFLGVYQDPKVTQDGVVDVDNLPVAGDEEKPVSWLGVQPAGDLGMVMTDENYRRRGLYSITFSVIAKLLISQSFFLHGYVSESNLAAQSVFQKSGCNMSHRTLWMSTDHTGQN